ncbi:hypothetical protein V2J09_009787 [Rumex salicifolius]
MDGDNDLSAWRCGNEAPRLTDSFVSILPRGDSNPEVHGLKASLTARVLCPGGISVLNTRWPHRIIIKVKQTNAKEETGERGGRQPENVDAHHRHRHLLFAQFLATLPVLTMEPESVELSSLKEGATSDAQPSNTVVSGQDNSAPSISALSSSGLSSWARNLKLMPSAEAQEGSQNGAASTFSRLTSGFGLRLAPSPPVQDKDGEVPTTTAQGGVFDTITKGLVDTSRTAVKAVQVKARHMVSQNKRRYQEGEFDLDMTYITENIIAMGFPAGDMSSGFFGYVEGFYRNHMDEVIKFFETHHKGKYKVYNLCSERLYDVSLFEGKAASFPFDDHNCPPLYLIPAFCQSAYSWLKQDIENVVVVHCKAGMGRTGLMIASLLMYLKFCPTAEESIDHFNQKRCVDGKGLVLPSQIRYVKYFECIMRDYNGENQPGRRCMLRGFRLHGCPYWIRPSISISDQSGILFSSKQHPKTKELMPEDFWINTSRKGVVVFALPGEPGLTELSGDFKIQFHDRHGDFYCWLNTTMISNKTMLSTDELDGFDKRKLPSPKFELEIVMIDYDGTTPKAPKKDPASKASIQENSAQTSTSNTSDAAASKQTGTSRTEDKDDVFSDSDGENGSSKHKGSQDPSRSGSSDKQHMSNVTQGVSKMSVSQNESTRLNTNAVSDDQKGYGSNVKSSAAANDFKAIAADASVFSFGDEEDFESE